MEDRNFGFNADVERMPSEHVRRLMCVILADTSGSMSTDYYHNNIRGIDQLNEGLHRYIEAVENDDMAFQCVETSLITFNSEVHEVLTFEEIDDFKTKLPTLNASGATRMNEAILTALRRIQERKEFLGREGINWWRPWIFLLTDGLATDNELAGKAQDAIKDAVNGAHAVFFPLAIGNSRETIQSLKNYVIEGAAVFSATEDKIGAMFSFLGNSMCVTSNHDVGNGNDGVGGSARLASGIEAHTFDPVTGKMVTTQL